MTAAKTTRRPARLAELERQIREAAPGWPFVPALTLEQARLLKPLLAERERLQG